MKKFAIFLLMLLPLLGFSACNDDDSIPDVTVTVDLSNVVDYQGCIYTVVNDTLAVDGIFIQGNNNKDAMISNVNYGWDNRFLGTNPVYPFSLSLIMSQPGEHLLSMTFTVAQVDKSLSVASMNLPVRVVESVDSLPAGTQLGNASVSYKIN